jgi:hypothetical protein
MLLHSDESLNNKEYKFFLDSSKSCKNFELILLKVNEMILNANSAKWQNNAAQMPRGKIICIIFFFKDNFSKKCISILH